MYAVSHENDWEKENDPKKLNDGNVGHIENTNKNTKQGSLEWVQLHLFGGQLNEYSSMGLKWNKNRISHATMIQAIDKKFHCLWLAQQKKKCIEHLVEVISIKAINLISFASRC